MFDVAAKKGKSERNQINFTVPEALGILIDTMLQKEKIVLSNVMREHLQALVNNAFDKKAQLEILEGEIKKRKAAGIPYEKLLQYQEELLPKGRSPRPATTEHA